MDKSAVAEDIWIWRHNMSGSLVTMEWGEEMLFYPVSRTIVQSDCQWEGFFCPSTRSRWNSGFSRTLVHRDQQVIRGEPKIDHRLWPFLPLVHICRGNVHMVIFPLPHGESSIVYTLSGSNILATSSSRKLLPAPELMSAGKYLDCKHQEIHTGSLLVFISLWALLAIMCFFGS